jgi:hypothetical protein
MTTHTCDHLRTRAIRRAGALALAVAATMALAPVTSAANLIQNGGFEVNDGFNDFANWSEFQFPAVTDLSHTGAAAVDFFADQTQGLSQSVATIVGATYRVQFWLAQGYDGPRALEVDFGGQTLLSLFGGTLDQPYTLMSYDVTATTNLSWLEFFGYNSGARYLLDDVSVELLNRVTPVPELPEPGTVSVLTAGLLGLVARRRAARADA